MGVGAVGVSAALLWQVALAGDRIRGETAHLAAAVAAEGYAMHHWLHEERTEPGTPPMPFPAEGAARVLDAAEAGRLGAHSATARWRRSRADATRPVLPRGWQVVHLVGRAGDLPDGVLVLRPSDEVVALPSWDAFRAALGVSLGRSEAGAEALATLALAASTLPAYDGDRDLALPASRFARIDTDAVLRQAHAGHPLRPAGTRIEMGGNDVADVGTVSAADGVIPVIAGACPGGHVPPGTLCAGGLELERTLTVVAPAGTTLSTASAEALTVATDVTGIDRIRTGSATVTGTVTTPAMTACADVEAARCGGGELDLESGSGTPDWTVAAIFGDTIIRDGNRLTGVRETFADTGAFGTLGNGALTVNVELRVVNPFIHCNAGFVPRCSR